MSQDKALFLACSLGNEGLQTVRSLHEQNMDFSIRDAYGNSVYHYACQAKSPKVKLLSFLLETGISLNLKNNDGNTPLHYLCYTSPESTLVICYLIENGALVNEKNNDGMTPLHVLYDGRLRLMEQYPTQKGNLIEFMRFSNRKPHSLSIDRLLYNKADANIANCFGDTPLHTLFRKKPNERRIEKLLDHGADLNACNLEGQTVLHLQFSKSFINVPLVEYMMMQGADLYIPDKHLKTPLHLLCMNKSVPIEFIKSMIAMYEEHVEKVKSKKPLRSLGLVNFFSFYCKSKKSEDRVNAQPLKSTLSVLDEKRSIREKDALSLFLNDKNIDLQTVKFLIKREVNLNIQNEYGNTLLHHICSLKEPCLNILSLMLHSKRANPNIQNKKGLTPFHILLLRKIPNYEIYRLFLKCNANPNLQSKLGETPFHLLCCKKEITFPTVRLFLKYKADPNITTGKGWSALDILVKRQESFLMKLFFVVHGAMCNEIPNSLSYFSLLLNLVKHFGGVDQLIDALKKNMQDSKNDNPSIVLSKKQRIKENLEFLFCMEEKELTKLSESVTFSL